MATSVKLDEVLKSRVRALANRKQRSAHWIMRGAIREYVDRADLREKFKQEAMVSWEAYQQTGRHLTNREVQDWLNTWGTHSESEPPVCHE